MFITRLYTFSYRIYNFK